MLNLTTPWYEQDIRAHIFRSLPHEPASAPALMAKPTSELLAIYCNWRMRFIPQRARRVHISKAFQRNPLSTDPIYQPAIVGLIQKIVAGDDLTPHLSRAILRPWQNANPGTGAYRSNLDLMLNDWNIHHLHISLTVAPDGFVSRTPMLVFAAFQREDAFLIDVLPHGAWTTSDIVDTLIDEWPKSAFVHLLPPTIKGLRFAYTDQERADLRKAGIVAPFFERHGRVYMIGMGGVTSAATALFATRHAMLLIKTLREWDTFAAANPLWSSRYKSQNGVALGSRQFKFEFLPNEQYRIRENRTGVLFPVPGFE